MFESSDLNLVLVFSPLSRAPEPLHHFLSPLLHPYDGTRPQWEGGRDGGKNKKEIEGGREGRRRNKWRVGERGNSLTGMLIMPCTLGNMIKVSCL